MSVIRTDKWLIDSYYKPLKLCKRLERYFNDLPAPEISYYLTQHGMYRRPVRNGHKVIQMLQEKKRWEMVEKELLHLQRKWNGPDVPVFIFPSDPHNRNIQREFNGKSGLAFKDKLFLFLTEDNQTQEIQALFTHEYNHVCRLFKSSKKEEDYGLLDTMILEGLAENAVRERLGDHYVAAWTSYYSDEELQNIWDQLLYPRRSTYKSDPKHHALLYGFRPYPKMAGYCVGYFLVKKYMESKHLTSDDLLNIEARVIAGLEG